MNEILEPMPGERVESDADKRSREWRNAGGAACRQVAGSKRLPALPPPPFRMLAAQLAGFPRRNSPNDKSKSDTRGLVVAFAKAMQLRQAFLDAYFLRRCRCHQHKHQINTDYYKTNHRGSPLLFLPMRTSPAGRHIGYRNVKTPGLGRWPRSAADRTDERSDQFARPPNPADDSNHTDMGERRRKPKPAKNPVAICVLSHQKRH